MKKYLYVTCVALVVSNLISFGKTFTSPLEGPNFVYFDEDIDKHIDRAKATRAARVREAF